MTLAIIGILLGTSIGGFGGQIDGAQTQKTTNNLKASIALARGESITHGGNVRFCGSSDGTTCDGSFNRGWLSYYDRNIDATLNNTDTILTWQEVDYEGTSVVATNSDGNEVTDFGFNYRGYPALPISLEVKGRSTERDLQLYANGRIEIQ